VGWPRVDVHATTVAFPFGRRQSPRSRRCVDLRPYFADVIGALNERVSQGD
jgi:hypothetical protein